MNAHLDLDSALEVYIVSMGCKSRYSYIWKALGNGYAITAIVGKKKIMN